MPVILLSRKDAAKALAISQRHLDSLIYAGALKVIRLGRSVRIRVADIEAFLAAQ